MAVKFILLEDNEDVLFFNSHAFKVNQLKQLLINEIERRSYEISQFCYINIQYHSTNILGDINWESKVIDCEMLKIGSQAWQKGKLRIKASIERVAKDNDPQKQITTNVSLEFSPDTPEITPPESPLDDLRQMINQETQS